MFNRHKQQREPPAYIKKRQDAERKWQEAKDNAYRNEIVAALQGINEQQETANNREKANEADTYRLERKRFWLSVGTVVGVWGAALLTAVQAGIFYVTMQDARTASSQQHTDTTRLITANTRAWVGPTDASFSAVPTKDQDLTVHIVYSNAGREPARSGNFSVGALFGNDDFILAYQMSQFVDKCLVTPDSDDGQITYPQSGFSNSTMGIVISKKSINENIDNINAGTRFIFIRACFVYRTAETVHHSASCFFYRGGKENRTDFQHLNYCPHWNHAD